MAIIENLVPIQILPDDTALELCVCVCVCLLRMNMHETEMNEEWRVFCCVCYALAKRTKTGK